MPGWNLRILNIQLNKDFLKSLLKDIMLNVQLDMS